MNRSIVSIACTAILLAGCGDSPAPVTAATSSQSQQDAEVTSGDVTIHASVLPTDALDAAVAHEYGIERSPHTVMLLVSLRRGPNSEEAVVATHIQATATDLSGHPQALALREVHSNGLVDYVGSVELTPPETLRFDIVITQAGGGRSTMQFTREFYPR